jgi:hypothetical protein
VGIAEITKINHLENENEDPFKSNVQHDNKNSDTCVKTLSKKNNDHDDDHDEIVPFTEIECA